MVFGFIATLIAYLLYDNQTPADCKEDDCKPQSDTVVVSADDNRILKIVAPTLTAVGLVIIICVRCWQQNTNRQTVAASGTATNDGEDNGGYQGPECKIYALRPSLQSMAFFDETSRLQTNVNESVCACMQGN